MRNIDRVSFRNFQNMRPIAAEGHITLDLTDPITGKVKHRQEGKNHIFTDSLFSGVGFDWVHSISQSYLVLTDSTESIDTSIPYVFGQTLGYGIPSLPGSGNYRGAYNSTYQVLAQNINNESLYWKFQYDFTTAQGNGNIGTIGLTSQHMTGANKRCFAHIPMGATLSGWTTGGSWYNYTCDGESVYICDSTGIVRIYNVIKNTLTIIDLSGTVGTLNYKAVAYDATTGCYFVCVYSSTASARYIYKFSDNTFSTLLATYSASNNTLQWGDYSAVYAYGNYLYAMSANNFYKIDYVNNGVPTAINAPPAYYLNTYTNRYCAGTMMYGNYIVCIPADSYTYYRGFVFDVRTDSYKAELSSLHCGTNAYGTIAIVDPIISSFLPSVVTIGRNSPNVLDSCYMNNCAIAAKKLDSVVQKTSDYGMTATYEVEVFWDAA